MKTPYSQVVNFSIQRELPRAFALEIAYIGRFGRHQLQQIDLAQPLDLVDPKSGQDYFSAATQLSKQKYAGVASVAAIPYFENMFPDAAGGGQSATQNIYNQSGFPATRRDRSTCSIFSALLAAEARPIASGRASMPACMRGRRSEAAATTPDRLRCGGR